MSPLTDSLHVCLSFFHQWKLKKSDGHNVSLQVREIGNYVFRIFTKPDIEPVPLLQLHITINPKAHPHFVA